MFSRNRVANRQRPAQAGRRRNYRFAQSPACRIVSGWAQNPKPGSDPDCQDRYPSPYLWPGPLRVGSAFSSRDARSFACTSGTPQFDFDPLPTTTDSARTTTNSGDRVKCNFLKFCQPSPCLRLSLAAPIPRLIPNGRSSGPLPVVSSPMRLTITCLPVLPSAGRVARSATIWASADSTPTCGNASAATDLKKAIGVPPPVAFSMAFFGLRSGVIDPRSPRCSRRS